MSAVCYARQRLGIEPKDCFLLYTHLRASIIAVSDTYGKCSQMLVLSRKLDEQIVIGDDIVITVGDKVRLGFEAPDEVPIHRQEVYEKIQRAKMQEPNGPPADIKPED